MQREGRPSRSPLVRLTTASADLALVAPSGDAEPGMTSRAPRRSRFLALVSATAIGLAARHVELPLPVPGPSASEQPGLA